MNTNTKLNITSIIGVKDGIDQIFTLINQHLDAYAQNTNDTPQIESCRTYVHQLNGLLDMLELNDITIVSQQMEKLMSSLTDRNIEPEPFVIETIQHTTRALLHYLNELIEGAEENPLRLFPVYRDIMQAQGVKNVSESSLFVSRMVSEPSFQAALFNMAPSEMGALAKKTRTAYQTAFLKWLRDSTDKESLQQMADAVSQIEKFPGSNQQRSFWWACTGFMDHLLQLEGDVELPTRKLCGKIEQEIRRLADGRPSSPGQLMRDVLYQVASSNADSERIREISHTYEWPSQLTASNDSSNASQPIDEPATQQATLDAMRKALDLTFDDWDKFSSGEHGSLEPLGSHTEELKQLVTQLNCPPFEKLITAISDAVTFLHAQPQDMSEALALELAAALLLVQASLEDFNQLSPEYPEQVDTLAARLRLITTGEQDHVELAEEPSPVQTRHHTQEKALHTQAAIEILANLERIESVLDKFFVDPALRPDLQKLLPLFDQINGVLVMAELDQANSLLRHCRNLVNQFSDSAHNVTPAEQSLIANGISSLGFFLEALKNAQPRNNYIIELAIAQFDNFVNTEPDTTTLPEEEVVSADTATDTTAENNVSITKETADVDPELLSVFLEEADEVLAEITGYLQICHDEPTQTELTTSLMRSFHTLKGSGRMVKLHDLGEVAWNMEQVLDHWANDHKPITEDLIHLLTRAHDTFRIWCDNLKQQGTTD
ncbi:MAG: Hpt domain-containing protein, partial [Nitrosomonas sp.]|nr:Hpt domain-containing protein [Nitrosomonas sp.]